MDGLHIVGRVPLAGKDVGLGDAHLDGLDGGDEGAQAVNLHGISLREELDDAVGHLGEHATDDVSTIDGVVLSHVVAEASQRDGLLLHSLGVVLSVGSSHCAVVVLAQVDFKLRILYCHCLIV